MRKKPRDIQKQRLYNWESKWIDALSDQRAKLELHECRRIAGRALARYGLDPAVRVGDGRGARVARGSAWRGITLPRWSRTPTVVLHETAHVICDRLMGSRASWHGPEFAAVFCDLIGWYFKVNAQLVARTADSCGIDVAWGGACPQPKTKRSK